MTRAALLLALLLVQGCTFGTRESSFTRPGGEEVTVSLGDNHEVTGELLAARREGLLLRTTGVFEIPWDEIESTSFDRLRDVRWPERSIPNSQTLEKLRLVSRFPQGLDEAMTRRLLEAYGQEGVRVCRVVDERLACEVAS
ncbi:MAG TPA: hypothetical protein VEY33_11695 [Gemmatimonadota bacterium]|nr:hypothetical protein [Gemmatimonadota bacterium]